MSKLIFILLGIVLLAACAITNPNERKELVGKLQKGEPGDDVICPKPPAEYFIPGVSAKLKASTDEIKDILNAEISIDQKTEKLRIIDQKINDFEVLQFHICTMYLNGVIDKKQYTEYIKNILPVEQKIINNPNNTMQSGEKNQSVSNAGNNNVAIQNITEIKPDFKKDTPQSNIVSKRIMEGIALTEVSDCAFTKEDDFNKYQNESDQWLFDTFKDLGMISTKAQTSFRSTSTNLGLEEIVTFTCPNGAIKPKEVMLRRKRMDRYVLSLREILKGL